MKINIQLNLNTNGSNALEYFVEVRESLSKVVDKFESERTKAVTLNEKLLLEGSKREAAKLINALRLLHFEVDDTLSKLK